jgi:hypothetical protein
VKTEKITLATNYLVDYKSYEQKRTPILVKDIFKSLDVGVDGTSTDKNSWSVISESEIRDRTSEGTAILWADAAQLIIKSTRMDYNGENTSLGMRISTIKGKE